LVSDYEAVRGDIIALAEYTIETVKRETWGRMYSVVTDALTVDHRHFLALLITLVDKGHLVLRCLDFLELSKADRHHTVAAIAEKLQPVRQTADLIAISSDNASTMRACFDHGRSHGTLQSSLGVTARWIPCMVHSLMLGVDDAKKCAEFAKFIADSTKVAVWAREDTQFRAMGLTAKAPLIQFKWNSIFQAVAFQGAHEEEIIRAAAALEFALPPVFEPSCCAFSHSSTLFRVMTFDYARPTRITCDSRDS
jgi:hypothetical protein